MSIHVCKCIHNGTEEFHLRMPGVSESRAEAIASLINSGKLDQAATSRQEVKVKQMLEALEAISAYMPKASASEGGASKFSGNVHAADKVRAAIAAAKE